jgi:hypothetical protein
MSLGNQYLDKFIFLSRLKSIFIDTIGQDKFILSLTGIQIFHGR